MSSRLPISESLPTKSAKHEALCNNFSRFLRVCLPKRQRSHTLVQASPHLNPERLHPEAFLFPSDVSIPSLSIPTSNPTGASLSSFSVTAFATVSVGGVASSDGATTYVIQQIEGVNGVTHTVTQTIVQGATVWREDAIHETCSAGR
ncbi:hypothetical protein B0H14DRAFT_3139221 [Mycena olivaceomarginata]|nr:hypothetical protein B0H14DRAFT_3139221 [Mycena olivaceomarginata]